MWIYAGGNSNFYYAITLVWALGSIILLSDTVWARLRKTWDEFLFDENDSKIQAECDLDSRRKFRNVPVVLK